EVLGGLGVHQPQEDGAGGADAAAAVAVGAADEALQVAVAVGGDGELDLLGRTGAAGGELLAPLERDAHGLAGDARELDGGDALELKGDLAAEAAADVRRENAHVGAPQASAL